MKVIAVKNPLEDNAVMVEKKILIPYLQKNLLLCHMKLDQSNMKWSVSQIMFTICTHLYPDFKAFFFKSLWCILLISNIPWRKSNLINHSKCSEKKQQCIRNCIAVFNTSIFNCASKWKLTILQHVLNQVNKYLPFQFSRLSNLYFLCWPSEYLSLHPILKWLL